MSCGVLRHRVLVESPQPPLSTFRKARCVLLGPPANQTAISPRTQAGESGISDESDAPQLRRLGWAACPPSPTTQSGKEVASREAAGSEIRKTEEACRHGAFLAPAQSHLYLLRVRTSVDTHCGDVFVPLCEICHGEQSGCRFDMHRNARPFAFTSVVREHERETLRMLFGMLKRCVRLSDLTLLHAHLIKTRIVPIFAEAPMHVAHDGSTNLCTSTPTFGFREYQQDENLREAPRGSA
ncbi:hypothetical protein B0H11DRAFT_698790 [Mycena galericulata]|nr:hypothetical protein B0H11DRAFT_698790 [Mycena galericulata]